MELSVQNIYGLLIRSRLLSPPDEHAMFTRWQDEAKDATNAGQFSKWMVAQSFVTEYQASLLRAAMPKAFFSTSTRFSTVSAKAAWPASTKRCIRSAKSSPSRCCRRRRQRTRRSSAGFSARRVSRSGLNTVMSFGPSRSAKPAASTTWSWSISTAKHLTTYYSAAGKLPPAEAVPVIYQALLGLEHLHEMNMVHRDLKPANLMLLPAHTSKEAAFATVKILDIGLARVLSEAGAPDKPDKAPLTSEGLLLGTPDYMAPEQARDARTADIRADIYSLGCVLYHALAGQPPFPDSNIISQMIRHASEPETRPLSEFNSTVPEGLQQIVNWMMAKEPGHAIRRRSARQRRLRCFWLRATSGPLKRHSTQKCSPI